MKNLPTILIPITIFAPTMRFFLFMIGAKIREGREWVWPTLFIAIGAAWIGALALRLYDRRKP